MRSSVVDPRFTEGEPRQPEGLEMGSSQSVAGHTPQFQPSTPATGQIKAHTDHAGVMNYTPTASRLTLAPAEGWFALILLAVAVYTVIASITAANWVGHTFILFWSAAIGLLCGLVVAKIRRMPQAILHLAACLLGHWLSIWLASNIAFHLPWVFLLQSLRTAIISGLGATAPPGPDVVFLFYLSFLCFYLGYFGTWLTYRARLPWLVALVYCAIMFINLNYVHKDLSYLVIILLAVLTLLIARIQLATKIARWASEGLYTDRTWLRKITWGFMRWASVFVLIIILISSTLPTLKEPSAGVTFWNRLDSSWTNVTHGTFSWQNPGTIFQAYQSSANFFSDHLTISGNVNLPTGEVLSYTSTAQPQYLEGFTYDHFDGHTWLSSRPSGQESFSSGTSLPMDTPSGAYKTATTNVFILQPPESQKHYIFAPAEPAMFDVAVTVDTNGTTSTWMQQDPLTRGERYRVTSDIPLAGAQALSAIPLPGSGQSVWANDSNYMSMKIWYLQTPADLSPQVMATARQWTRGATNTYAAMKMLEAHLSDSTVFTYSTSNPPVPNNVDAVSWLLQTHQGYCTYYATAMTIMARLLDVPARVVSGFSFGHFNAQHKAWIVNGSDAHSWVQVYFPNYGWINFEPTPGFSLNGSTQPGKSGPTSSPIPTKHPTRKPGPGKGNPSHNQHRPGNHSGGPTTAPDPWSPPGLLWGLALFTLFCSLCFLLFALCSRWWRNLYAGANLVSGMFWRVCRIAGWAGIPPRAWQTPYEYSSTLMASIGNHKSQSLDTSGSYVREAATLRRLTDLFVRSRWAAPHEALYATEASDLQRLWPHLRNTLLRLIPLRIGRAIAKRAYLSPGQDATKVPPATQKRP